MFSIGFRSGEHAGCFKSDVISLEEVLCQAGIVNCSIVLLKTFLPPFHHCSVLPPFNVPCLVLLCKLQTGNFVPMKETRSLKTFLVRKTLLSQMPSNGCSMGLQLAPVTSLIWAGDCPWSWRSANRILWLRAGEFFFCVYHLTFFP